MYVNLKNTKYRTRQQFLWTFSFVLALVFFTGVIIYIDDSHFNDVRFVHDKSIEIKTICDKFRDDDFNGALNGNWDIKSKGLFSQFKQDLVLVDIFKSVDTTGFTFIDLGAAFAQKLSNTYLLERCFGWHGLCIDADIQKAALLKKHRTCKVINQCIENEKKTVRFRSSLKSGKNTIIQDASQFNRLHSHDIECDTFESILQDHSPSRDRVDLLSIDIEGYEYEAISSLDEGSVKFDIIIFEMRKYRHVVATDKKKTAIYDYLVTNEYIPIMGFPTDISRKCKRDHSDDPGLDVYMSPLSSVFYGEKYDGTSLGRFQTHDVMFIRSDSLHLPHVIKYMEC